jgi:hypothetical protein
MTSPFELRILDGEATISEVRLEEEVVLGRRAKGDPGLYQLRPATPADPAKLVIAPRRGQ